MSNMITHPTLQATYDIYNSEVIDRVISICNWLFYGGDKPETTDNSATRILKEAKKTFTDFYGENHKKLIDSKFNNTNIALIYQVVGENNSIEQFLIDSKIKLFSQQTKLINETGGLAFEIISNLLNSTNNDLSAIKELKPDYFYECMLALGMVKDEVFHLDSSRDEYISRVHEYATIWKETPYSQDPDKNNAMLFLESFVDMYNQMLMTRFEKQSPSYDIAYDHQQYLKRFDHKNRTRLDPILNKLCDGLPKEIVDGAKKFLCQPTSISAMYLHNNDKDSINYVAFGIQPSDHTVLHELEHAFDGGGFERNHLTFSQENQTFRDYEIFNEVITDLMSVLMAQLRKNQGKSGICGDTVDNTSSYSRMFDIMKDFFRLYIDEIKNSRTSDTPLESFAYSIGNEEFVKLNSAINVIFKTAQEKNLYRLDSLSNLDAYNELCEVLDRLLEKKQEGASLFSLIRRKSAFSEFMGFVKDKQTISLLQQAIFDKNNTNAISYVSPNRENENELEYYKDR